MLASALCRNQRAAIGLTMLLILLFTVGGPALGVWLAWKQTGVATTNLPFLFSSPVYSYFAAFDKMLARGAGPGFTGFYWSVGIVHATGLGLSRRWRAGSCPARGTTEW